MTPPEPIRISFVAAPMAASSTSGELPARQWAFVMLGHPEATVAQPFGLPGQGKGLLEGLNGRYAFTELETGRVWKVS